MKNRTGQNMQKKLVVSITGASGIIYGIRMVSYLLTQPYHIILTVSEGAREVMKVEMETKVEDIKQVLKEQVTSQHNEAILDIRKHDDFRSPSASGSFRHDGMIVIPCSMKTLAQVASGLADNLITRSADVCLKERMPLIMVVRETPYSLIHIENMKALTLAGATILPATPSFYTRPETVEDIVDTVNARVLDNLNIKHNLMSPWGSCGNNHGSTDE